MSGSSLPSALTSSDLNTDRLICITNLSTQLTEQDLKNAFQDHGQLQSIRLFNEINAGYVQFGSDEDFKKALALKQIKIKGRKYQLKSYRQMQEQMHRFSRSDLMNLSGRWASKFSGLFNGNNAQQQPQQLSSKFYIDLNENQQNQQQQRQLNPFDEEEFEDESELYDEIQPSTSNANAGGSRNGTIPFIDEKLLTINGLNPSTPQKHSSQSIKKSPKSTPQTTTPSSNSTSSSTKSKSKEKPTAPSKQTPKNFKQKTKIDDQLWAKDLLIEELRVHLNLLSAQNESLKTQKNETDDELSKQMAENFTLIEQNQQLKDENVNFMAMLRDKFETHSNQLESPFQDCCVCMTQKSNCALYKCGHVCLCNSCVYLWQSNEEGICPVCRQRVEAVIRVYI